MTSSGRHLAAKLVEWIALGLLAVVTAIKVAPTTANWPFDLQNHVVQHYVLLVGVLNAIAIVARILEWVWGTESKQRVKAILNVLDDVCFKSTPREERFHNRVTLFRKSAYLRWRHRLVGFCRAGDNYQQKIPSFVVDANEQRRNKGFSGQAWFRDSTLVVNDLPEVPSDPENWDPESPACQEYCNGGFLDHDQAAQLRVKSRSILATPVRDLRGNRWGVLVVDSRDPGMIDDRKKDLAESIATALGKMLGRTAK
jgi:hypothetical protein